MSQPPGDRGVPLPLRLPPGTIPPPPILSPSSLSTPGARQGPSPHPTTHVLEIQAQAGKEKAGMVAGRQAARDGGEGDPGLGYMQ